ncbi:hypothetical protein BWK59_02485 [Flavobacterium davisii]|uniref:Uncharacterized protein n=1 Tax=Flavobacterium davisii TaxID=2906077 RepID=A0A246GL13_9FLAO|nr:hypothetical protein [Flavobacterium davisii]OWP84989.1 hypothetical protein BWK59_02485 [Flavobacterium davisii]
MSNSTTQSLSVEKLLKFVNKDVGAEELAKYLRQGAYIIARTAMSINEIEEITEKDWLDNAYYHITELAEVLDPSLSK